MKRILCLILIVLTVASLPSCSLRERKETNDSAGESDNPTRNIGVIMQNKDYQYTVTEEGITLLRYIGTQKDISIPQTIDGLDVTVIGNDCFAMNENIVSVELSNRLTTVQRFAFYRCTKLSKLVIKNGLRYIEGSAFAYCTALTSIVFPKTVVRIGECAFANCTELSNVSFDGQRELEIGAAAFSETALTQMVLPDGTISISNAAFMNCKKLKKVYLPNSITNIKNNAFKKSPKTILYVGANTYAASFAKANNERFKVIG